MNQQIKIILFDVVYRISWLALALGSLHYITRG